MSQLITFFFSVSKIRNKYCHSVIAYFDIINVSVICLHKSTGLCRENYSCGRKLLKIKKYFNELILKK